MTSPFVSTSVCGVCGNIRGSIAVTRGQMKCAPSSKMRLSSGLNKLLEERLAHRTLQRRSKEPSLKEIESHSVLDLDQHPVAIDEGQPFKHVRRGLSGGEVVTQRLEHAVFSAWLEINVHHPPLAIHLNFLQDRRLWRL